MLAKFIALLLEMVKIHCIYVWGAQGEKDPTISETWIKKKETSTANANRAIAYWKKQCNAGYKIKLRAFDCSGLGVWALQQLGLIKGDMTANGLMGKCEKISKSELKRGDFVFRVYESGSNKGKAYHVGYIVDDDLNVVEAKGRDDGVVKRKLNASGSSYWNRFGRPEYFKSEIEGKNNKAATTTTAYDLYPSLKIGDSDKKKNYSIPKGGVAKDWVKYLQKLLNKAGNYKLAEDGVFGAKTENAVKAWKIMRGNKQPGGVIGKDSWRKLEDG